MIKGVTDKVVLRNGAILNGRIVQPPMMTDSGNVTATISTDSIDYYRIRAKSSSMIIVKYVYDNTIAQVENPSHLTKLLELTKTIKQYGSKAIAQLDHSGCLENSDQSSTSFGLLDYDLDKLTDFQIHKMIKDYGQATKKIISMGFDGIEIRCSNHNVLQRFFSKLENNRDDKWGRGSLQTRLSLIDHVAQEIYHKVKAFAPKDFIIGFRLNPEEIREGQIGYTCADSLRLVQHLLKSFPFDYIHLSLSHFAEKSSTKNDLFSKLFSSILDNETKLIVVGNINSEEAVNRGLEFADLVAAGRANVIDPEFGLKIFEGRGGDIISTISPEQVKKAKLTPTLLTLFSNPKMEPHLPGRESIYHLHQSMANAALKMVTLQNSDDVTI